MLLRPINLNVQLNVQPRNLVFLKTYNTAFDETIITFTNQNGKPIEIEDKS